MKILNLLMILKAFAESQIVEGDEMVPCKPGFLNDADGTLVTSDTVFYKTQCEDFNRPAYRFDFDNDFFTDDEYCRCGQLSRKYFYYYNIRYYDI